MNWTSTTTYGGGGALRIVSARAVTLVNMTLRNHSVVGDFGSGK